MTQPQLELYDLAGADLDLRFSPFCWKTKMALAHKGLAVQTLPWRFSDKHVIAFASAAQVPVLVHQGEAISDSWRIAQWLEQRFPERPALFPAGAGAAATRFLNAWADGPLAAAIAKLVLRDIHDRLHEDDQPYFRDSRERAIRTTLEAFTADRAAGLEGLRKTLRPLRDALAEQPFLAGDAPAYIDYSVFGFFMWARCVSPLEILPGDDPVLAWREKLLDAFGGFARQAKSA